MPLLIEKLSIQRADYFAGKQKMVPGPLRLKTADGSGVEDCVAKIQRQKKIQGEKQQIMEIRLHLNSAHLSKVLSVSHRSPECFSSRPSNPSALGLDVLSLLEGPQQEKNTLHTGNV